MEVLLRFRHRGLPMSAAVRELRALARRPALVSDSELCALLASVAAAHRAGRLRTHEHGAWVGAPTGVAIAEHCGISKGKVRVVRDAYYTLCLGVPPLNADEFALGVLTGGSARAPDGVLST